MRHNGTNIIKNALIVDDDSAAARSLEAMITAECPNVKLQAICHSVDDAVNYLKTFTPHLIFLDVEMPHRSGFDLLLEINPSTFDVIFTTAYHKYTLDAIRVSAFDYLLKPICKTELADAMRRYENKIVVRNHQLQLEVMKETVMDIRSRIALATADSIEVLQLAHIIRIEAKGAYSVFHCIDKKKLTVARSIKNFEDILPANQFFRVHHSHIVNFDHVVRFKKSDGGSILMNDLCIIPVSRHKKMEFLDRLEC